MKFLLWGIVIAIVYWYYSQLKKSRQVAPPKANLIPKQSPNFSYLKVPIYMPLDFMQSQYIGPINEALAYGNLGKVKDAQSFKGDYPNTLIEIEMDTPEKALQVVRSVLRQTNNPEGSTLQITTKDFKTIYSPV